MNREEAEKLLAALIFGDLDEASKTDLTAYLQTDDELRERLADMRMAVKVASDTLQHGPDPVLGKKRLKHLARLARRPRRTSAVFTVRYMAAAAAILIAVILPSFLIFNRTDNLKRAHDNVDRWSRMNDKYDIDFNGGSGSKIIAGVPLTLLDSDGEATEESLEGKKQFAKALRDETTHGGGTYIDDSVTQLQHRLHGGQVGAENNGQIVKFGDGHLTLNGDVDTSFGGGIAHVAVDGAGDRYVDEIDGRGTFQDAVDAAVDGDTTVIERKYYYNAPTDAVAVESSSGDIKADWDYEDDRGGGQYRLKPDSAGEIARHGATIRTGEKLTESLDSFDMTGEFDRQRSITADSDMPAYMGKPRSAPAKIPPGTKRPALLPPVVASARPEESDPKARPESWTRETGTINTESEEMASFRKQIAGSKNDADGKEFDVVMSPKHTAPASEISGPSGDVRYNAVIVDSLEKYSVFEETQKGQTSPFEMSDVEGIAHDKIYTLTSKNNRIVLHEEMGNADSFLINDTEGSIELTKDKNEPLKIELSATRSETGSDMVFQIENGDPATLSPELMKLLQQELSTPPISCKLEARILDEQGMASISEGTASSGEKRAKDAELRAGLRANLEENYSSRFSNSDVPVGEDEPDLPPASRFKSVPVNPWVMTGRDSLSTFGLDVDTASYTLCRRYISGGFLPPVGAVRMEEFINYFNYHYPQRKDRTFTVHAEAAASPFAGKGKNLTLLKIGVKARTLGRDQRKAAHLIFVVDASASMGKPDRLGLVQQALNLLIDRLSPADRVTLITCANESRLHLETVSASERERIRKAIDAIQPSGPTNLLAGLKLGYAVARRSFAPKQINHVVLCSDGVANVGQTNAEAVLRDVAADKKQGITLTCVGVGFGSYNDAFMEALANSGDGSYVFLDSMRQAQRVFVEQLSATLHTVAKDARIQVDFNPDRVRRYRLIGYENRDIEDNRFRDDTVDAGEVGSGQCSTALYELELTGQPSADQQGDMGTVFVRYRNADTGQMEEISSRLKSAIVQRRTVKSSPRFFLASAAARFAEILRQSEHAQGGNLAEVIGIAEQVSLTLPLDRDVRELVELVRKAEHLPRSQ